jgi:crotonobetainyl-CoA:carnitine CoA-transferase CaiB-like acyl-CoA transferase
MAQGMSGLMSVTGEPDGTPGAGPMRVGIPIIDILTGMYASIAICAALAHRAQAGVGQHLDLALLDTSMAFLSIQGMTYLTTGEAPGRIGNTHPSIVPYQVFPTRDGSVILACGNDNLFSKFCEAAGCKHLVTDERFAKNAGRVQNRAILVPMLNDVFAQKSTKEWVAILEEAGVPNGPINSIAEAFEEEQVKARGVKFDLPHPTGGTVPMISSPMKFSATPLVQGTAPPTLGQHTEAVLGGILGLDAAGIAKLREAGAI